MRNKKYIDFKNYLHNELKITREYIYEIINVTVEKYVIEKIFGTNGNLHNLVLNKITQIINDKKDISNSLYDSYTFTTYFKNLVEKEVKNQVEKRINFDSIELVKKSSKSNKFILGALLPDSTYLYYTGRDFRKAYSDNEKVISFETLEDAQFEVEKFLKEKYVEPQNVIAVFIHKAELINNRLIATHILETYIK